MLRARYRRITFFFARVLISIIFWDLVLPRLGLRALALRTRPRRLLRSAAAFRVLAVRMGGVMIKVGQFFSARVDVLPEEITDELAGLQDEVAPETFEAVKAVMEADLGVPLGERFAHVDTQPLAAASLGQVHRAQLLDPGDGSLQESFSVVVKVQRPAIERIVATDLAALRRVANWIKRYPPIRRRADVDALLDEFSQVLYEEIDYLAEGRNAEAFAAMFTGDPDVRVPRVVWSHTTRRVLTLEDVYAIKITEYAAITAAGIERSDVADRLFRTYLKQIFEEGFFHADPHPGNLFVTPDLEGGGGEPGGWRLTFVDFGMVGRVPPTLRAGLRELVIAVATRDPDRMLKAYQMMGILLPGADLDLIRRAEETAFEQFYGKTMNELREISYEEVRAIAQEFRQLLYQIPFQVPEDLILLGRSVGILSGMCTGLHPDFNLWEGLTPFAERLIAQEATSGWEVWLEELRAQAGALWRLPRRVEALATTMERGQLAVRAPEVVERVRRVEAAVTRLVGGLVFAAFLIGGVQLYLGGAAGLSALLLTGALASLLWTLLKK